jgi:hypothetical protein
MSRLHVAVQLLPPPHHGPAGLVDHFSADAAECSVRIAEALEHAALDGTLAIGGCLSITVQRVPVKAAEGSL